MPAHVITPKHKGIPLVPYQPEEPRKRSPRANRRRWQKFHRCARSKHPACDGPETGHRLARYKLLTRPVRIAPPPEGAALDEIECRMPRAATACEVIRRRVAIGRCLYAQFVRLPPILLVGPPGCGKSWLARQLRRRSRHVPLL
jgi:hypothetical protein